MMFTLNLFTSVGGIKNIWVNDLSRGLENHFADKNYGDDLKGLFIAILAAAPEFDFYFKPRKKPRYRQGKKILTTYGTEYEVEDAVDYDLKIDYKAYTKFKEEDFKRNLKREILISIQELRKIKKLRDFDFESFERDLRNYFKID